MATSKGFIKDQAGNILLPITRGELLLDQYGNLALHSDQFLAQPAAADGTGGCAGLMSAAEKAILNGAADGQNLVDVYAKLGYINTGIKVGTTVLNFYNEDGGTPITLMESDTAPIEISTANNIISFGLKETTVTNDNLTTRIKDITVDKYGRVTAVTHGSIADSELPTTLADKTLNNAVVGTIKSTTTDGKTSYDANAVVPKSYIDSEIAKVNAIATGALVFNGTIDKNTVLDNLLTATYVNGYYKVVPDSTNKAATITINANQDYHGVERKARLGDTIIVVEKSGAYKFVHIPSGDDDVVTSFSINEGNTPVLDSVTGNVGIKFVSDALSVVDSSSTTLNQVTVTLPKADKQNNGYLSKDDWEKFAGYETNLAVSYTQTVAGTAYGAYQIGTIKIGNSNAITIYGQNYESSLSLSSVNNVPTLTFEETGSNDVEIKVNGVKGVKASVVNGNLQLEQNVAVKSGSGAYLAITDDENNAAKEFAIKIGTGATDETNGLADTKFVLNAISNYTSSFEVIAYSLKSTTNAGTNDPYRYGNEALRKAIGGKEMPNDANEWTALVI